MTIDYGTTIHLPKTDFPRRAGLAKKEPEILARWDKMDLYKRQRDVSKGRDKFVLHMGPPFANGHIHMGTALSTLLKDIVTRSYQALGYDAPLVPGFDCHGLPIEWKVEESYRAAGKNKDDVSPVEFREECRQFAQKWLGVQSEEFQRLGILGDWENPYLTMRKESEALIAKEIHKFLQNGSLYRGSKPVMWSVPEQTALAEAEVEYKDHTSDTVWVKFPIKSGGPAALDGASIVIWTTTPWTLPGNRAVAYGPKLDYVGITLGKTAEDSIAQTGDKLLVTKALYDTFLQDTGVEEAEIFWEGKGSDLEGIICHHPLHEGGYDFDVPALAADFATDEAGTGFVHIAPGHGEDDYKLGMQHNIAVPHTVAGDGVYTADVPMFEGLAVYTSEGKKGPANKLVSNAILEAGNLVAKGQITHSYPHSWRSKSPVIFRNTPQWFISLAHNDLREKAMAEIKKTRWVPERGERRIGAMVEQRGDWCISRQRAWGVPIAIFVDKKTGEPLQDEAVLNRIIDIFMEEGSDAWFDRPMEDFLGNDYSADDYEQIRDIIDVWFESGSTHGFVLEQRPDLHWPADLYLEGSDQHRGWFQSSLLVSSGTRGTAPYKAVLTHGFILDEKGYKMSKSIGNVVSPMDLTGQYGADIVRLWVVGSDYTEDLRIGKNVLQGHIDIYRRIRNTFCYLLGNLSDFNAEQDAVDHKALSEFDRWVLHRLYEIDQVVRQAIHDFDFKTMITVLHNFCSKELSAFYFDVNKDNLYCNAKTGTTRRATQTVLEIVFNHLCHWLSPVLSFTTEEAWLSRKGLDFSDLNESIHLSTMPKAPADWQDGTLAAKWEKLYAVRRVVTGAIEIKRADKEVRSSLEASPKLYIEDAALKTLVDSTVFEDVCITSDIEVISGAAPEGAFTLEDVEGVGVIVEMASGDKCERCWKYTEDVGEDSNHPEICARCADVVSREMKEAA